MLGHRHIFGGVVRSVEVFPYGETWGVESYASGVLYKSIYQDVEWYVHFVAFVTV
jgi:hypothetical protein